MSGVILVTGATGFIGRHLIAALAAAGYSVAAHSSVAGDIGHSFKADPGASHVFHLAARTFVPDSWRDTAAFYSTNVQGTVNVLEYCRAAGASLTLLSSYVYGIPSRLPISEDDPVAAVNPYAHSKILAEEVARFYARQFGLTVAVVRPFNIYGPDQSRRFLIAQLVHAALDPGAAEIAIADPEPRRDYLHVDDLVRLLLIIMERRAGGTFNAGSGGSVSVSQLAASIRELAATAKPVVAHVSPRVNEIPDVVADISKARRELGWTPSVSLDAGLQGMVARERQRLESAR